MGQIQISPSKRPLSASYISPREELIPLQHIPSGIQDVLRSQLGPARDLSPGAPACLFLPYRGPMSP